MPLFLVCLCSLGQIQFCITIRASSPNTDINNTIDGNEISVVCKSGFQTSFFVFSHSTNRISLAEELAKENVITRDHAREWQLWTGLRLLCQ